MRLVRRSAAVIAAVSCVHVVSAIDLPSPRSAAVDQPRVNVAVARPGTPNTPIVGSDPFGGDSILIQAFYDTGASGLVLDPDFADVLGINIQTVNGQPVVFGDVGGTGVSQFNVSEPLIFHTADSLGYADGLNGRDVKLTDPAAFSPNVYKFQTGPARAQVGPIGGGGIFSSDLNVIGTPAMAGRVVTFDSRPTNGYLDFYTKVLTGQDITEADLDVYMYTSTHRPGTAYNPASVLNPGIPLADFHIQTTFGDFDRYSTITPGGERPTTAANPFVGPNPITGAGDAPGIKLSLGSSTSEGSWLFDTGAAASFISTEQAGNLGVSYDPNNPLGSADPKLLGVPESRQFTLTIQGIAGEQINIAGFYADEMLIRTVEGNSANDDDPNHLNFAGMPVLVNDITLRDPDTGELLTLDGILGVNPFVASVDFELVPGEFLPIITDFTEAPFDLWSFDQTTGLIGLDTVAKQWTLPGGEPVFDNAAVNLPHDQMLGGLGQGIVRVPEPGSLLLLAVGPMLLLRRKPGRSPGSFGRPQG